MYIDPEPIIPDILWARPQIIGDIDNRKRFDVAVIGGGIHGAAVAHLAVLNGLSTVLLEMADYASGTSSRSSKLAHGGLRYLAMGDFRQVYESVRSREELYRVAPHLVQPYPFLIPVAKGGFLQRAQYAIGLSAYEFGNRASNRTHHWIPSESATIQAAFGERAKNLQGCYQYFDGIMSDTRLVIEAIFAARQEGARCLNYAKVNSIAQQPSGDVRVGWSDLIGNQSHELSAGIVINCAGPWAPSAGRLSALPDKLRYSRGSHLIFSVPWHHPALFLPLDGKNRFYFVLPHRAGTLVGTTERECSGEMPSDPLPTREEVDEILERLHRDIPQHRLDRSTLTYGFAGIRSLPVRQGSRDVSTISRRHRWELNGGVLSLYGGKYTSAYWTAYEGLREIEKLSGGFELKDLGGRLLPGAFKGPEALEEALKMVSGEGEEQQQAIRATHKIFGGQLRHMAAMPDGLKPLGGTIIKGAIEFACRYEQVETLEDLLRRRLELEYLVGQEDAVFKQVATAFSEYSGIDSQVQLANFEDRIQHLREVLGI